MDITNILAAFGLSASSGLNAYLTMLVVGLTAKYTDLIELGDPFQGVLTNWWVLGTIIVLMTLEMIVDKVPGADTVNDIIHTFIRPVAGAMLFAANAGTIVEMDPAMAAIAGLIVSGTVHGAKSLSRPVVTASTAGTGNWLVSTVEDVVAFVGTGLAIIGLS